MAGSERGREREVAEHSSGDLPGAVPSVSVLNEDVPELSLAEQLMGVLERNTEAITRMAAASERAADANDSMSTEIRYLRGIINGAQKMVGGELGKNIDQAKAAHAAMLVEADRARKSSAS